MEERSWIELHCYLLRGNPTSLWPRPLLPHTLCFFVLLSLALERWWQHPGVGGPLHPRSSRECCSSIHSGWSGCEPSESPTTRAVTCFMEITSPQSRRLRLIIGEFSRGPQRPRVITAVGAGLKRRGRGLLSPSLFVWCFLREEERRRVRRTLALSRHAKKNGSNLCY